VCDIEHRRNEELIANSLDRRIDRGTLSSSIREREEGSQKQYSVHLVLAATRTRSLLVCQKRQESIMQEEELHYKSIDDDKSKLLGSKQEQYQVQDNEGEEGRLYRLVHSRRKKDINDAKEVSSSSRGAYHRDESYLHK